MNPLSPNTPAVFSESSQYLIPSVSPCRADFQHTAAAITVVVGIVCAGGPLNLAIRPYLPIYIVSHSLSATTPLCRPGAASCWLSAWSGLGMLAIYAAIAMVLGALILAWRDA
jgi:ABC-2 type transport system permease protein